MSPDRRRHRGAHPEDARLFEPSRLEGLRVAVSELSWLLSRGYQTKSALKLVGISKGADRKRQERWPQTLSKALISSPKF